MNRIIVRAIGKLNEAWLREGVDMYVERCKPYAQIQIIELPEGHAGSAKPDLPKTRRLEAEALLKSRQKDAFYVALDETGKELTSETLAKKLNDLGQEGRMPIFLIGGSWGLDEGVRTEADFVLSLGKMTLPHGLARLVLAEQLYRALSINAGKAYHK